MQICPCGSGSSFNKVLPHDASGPSLPLIQPSLSRLTSKVQDDSEAKYAALLQQRATIDEQLQLCDAKLESSDQRDKPQLKALQNEREQLQRTLDELDEEVANFKVVSPRRKTPSPRRGDASPPPTAVAASVRVRVHLPLAAPAKEVTRALIDSISEDKGIKEFVVSCGGEVEFLGTNAERDGIEVHCLLQDAAVKDDFLKRVAAVATWNRVLAKHTLKVDASPGRGVGPPRRYPPPRGLRRPLRAG